MEAPDKEKVLQDIKPLVRLLWDAFEIASPEIQTFFSEQIKTSTIDPALAPCMMRFVVKKHLLDHGYRVKGMHVKEVPNNGLYVVLTVDATTYHVRMWKKGEEGCGGLPDPRDSHVKNLFLRQQQMTLDDMAADWSPIVNLAIIWDVDSRCQVLRDGGLTLVKPKRDDSGIAAIEAEWRELLEHPVVTVMASDAKHTELFETDELSLQLELTDSDEDEIDITRASE